MSRGRQIERKIAARAKPAKAAREHNGYPGTAQVVLPEDYGKPAGGKEKLKSIAKDEPATSAEAKRLDPLERAQYGELAALKREADMAVRVVHGQHAAVMARFGEWCEAIKTKYGVPDETSIGSDGTLVPPASSGDVVPKAGP